MNREVMVLVCELGRCRSLFDEAVLPVYIVSRVSPRLFRVRKGFTITVPTVVAKPGNDWFDLQAIRFEPIARESMCVIARIARQFHVQHFKQGLHLFVRQRQSCPSSGALLRPPAVQRLLATSFVFAIRHIESARRRAIEGASCDYLSGCRRTLSGSQPRRCQNFSSPNSSYRENSLLNIGYMPAILQA